MGGIILELTSENFESEVLNSDLPVLVDFWAPWCAPCRALAPTLEEIAKELSGKVKVRKLNVDDYPEIASTYGIMSIPTLILFRGGKVLHKMVGNLPKKKILDEISRSL